MSAKPSNNHKISNGLERLNTVVTTLAKSLIELERAERYQKTAFRVTQGQIITELVEAHLGHHAAERKAAGPKKRLARSA